MDKLYSIKKKKNTKYILYNLIFLSTYLES